GSPRPQASSNPVASTYLTWLRPFFSRISTYASQVSTTHSQVLPTVPAIPSYIMRFMRAMFGRIAVAMIASFAHFGNLSELRHALGKLENESGVVGSSGPGRLVLVHDPGVRPVGYARAAA